MDSGPRFVSRGGEKLEAALEAFKIHVDGLVCADVGASTGGFTDCLLQRGAAKVYAIDVGKGILHWKLRNDPRVIVMEETNARFVESLPEPVDLVTVDASFISLKILLPVVKKWIPPSPLRSTPPIFEENGGSRRGAGNWVRVGDPNQAIFETFTTASPERLRAHPEQSQRGHARVGTVTTVHFGVGESSHCLGDDLAPRPPGMTARCR